MKFVVGYWFRDNKSKRLNINEFAKNYESEDLEYVKIDLTQDMELQGRFDVIIHKFLDLIVQPMCASDEELAKVEEYCANRPDIVMLDPLCTLPVFLDRFKQYRLTCSVLQDKALLNKRIFSPTYCLLTTNNEEECLRCCQQNEVRFPMVIKPQVAHGETAHSMCIIFSKDGFRDIEVPCVAQTFINHNAKLFKIYVVGTDTCIFDRPSIKNMTDEHQPSLFFTTKDISKDDSDHALTHMEEAEGEIADADHDLFNEITRVYSRISGFNFYGIDLIFCNKTSKYAIIDVNCFPSYENMPNFYASVDNLVREKLNLKPARE